MREFNGEGCLNLYVLGMPLVYSLVYITNRRNRALALLCMPVAENPCESRDLLHFCEMHI